LRRPQRPESQPAQAAPGTRVPLRLVLAALGMCVPLRLVLAALPDRVSRHAHGSPPKRAALAMRAAPPPA
jgi:hypothetical protein